MPNPVQRTCCPAAATFGFVMLAKRAAQAIQAPLVLVFVNATDSK
jgi:hypothetical protein